ncbi:Inactive TPR repeat-containing thioredoxin TTL3 [Hibiscus syriacus]|uniref:Inactive TPR repeat-containing thioredoxin TTL3 n=1 Tax=Hibiscus syriacus TaxID=106335 RepID=A0A6A3BZQ1_HIBSY|nr:inactive TPR repeat-containing thioredoxin TTL3-like [Hibiscus syriacus]KAE8720409.1 Inactive TPR repeat-containing thioredoxin TTL3 [Hibiscus syriacus]
MSSHSERPSFDREMNKPDFKELDLIGSPVSPLHRHNNGGGAAATTTSSGGNSSNSSTGSVSSKNSNSTGTHFSGELLEKSAGLPGSAPTNRIIRPGHRRSVSAGLPLIYSGSSFTGGTSSFSSSSSSASSNPSTILPSGNICPSWKIVKTMGLRTSNKTDTLGGGKGNYGHGSIIRGGGGAKSGPATANPEEMKRAGNEMYKRGNFSEALALYDKAISISPENSAYRSNRAAALAAAGRLGEAVRECEEAVRLDPGYGRAHQRLSSLYLRLGLPDNARHHLCLPGQHSDPAELQKLQLLEIHINRCADARKIGDWKTAVREIDAAIAVGADSSTKLIACKAEALLKLHQIEESDYCLSNISKPEHYTPSLQIKYFGMVAEAYVLFVQAQVEMALGRFENAVSAVEKARRIDYSNAEIAMVLNNVKMVARERTHGNELFNAGRYAQACSAYGEGLRCDSSNSVLYCNRAVCWSKLGLWEKSVEDCNQALKIQPNYKKALLRRAASNGKLGRWADAVRDYELLRKELPGDIEVAESLHNAQVALKKSRGVDIHKTKISGEVEEISSLERFKIAISSPGISMVHFKVASNEQCEELTPFVNLLCVRYPSIHFYKVDAEESLVVAKAEGIRTVPTFKIYKNGDKVKEMISPTHQILEDSVRNYIL